MHRNFNFYVSFESWSLSDSTAPYCTDSFMSMSTNKNNYIVLFEQLYKYLEIFGDRAFYLKIFSKPRKKSKLCKSLV